MEITLQYFDGCPNWEVLDHRIAEALHGRTDASIIRQRVGTTEEAVRLGFHGSPTILIDGIDARQIDPAELRRAIGFVPQDVTLFYGTLKHNIAMGAPFADDSAILAAAELAGVQEFANTHPEGFDMPIGERGESLSGGQRQRVAIARAFLKDAPVLILDEATASLDAESEAQIQQELDRLVEGRTALIVAHRFSSIRVATRILVFEGGRIVGDGSHAELYASCPLYRELYDRQSL